MLHDTPVSTSSTMSPLSEVLARCARDPVYFLKALGTVSIPNGGAIPFTLWDFQADLLQKIHDPLHNRHIILKARQLGISWLMAGYALHTAMFQSGANVLMLSLHQPEASALLDKARHMWRNLPQPLRPTITKDNESLIQFKSGNKIQALPSTQNAGRSETASLVIVDEAAHQEYAEENYGAYKPTVDGGGKLVVLSTANGRGNFYHRLWSEAPENGFIPHFLPWNLRPGRTPAWYANQILEFSARPRLLAQEFPSNAVEAFLATGGCIFEIDAIERMLQQCRPPIETSKNGALKVWSQPMVSKRYVIGADVAEGKEQNDSLDYSGGAVYDWQTLTHVADLHYQAPVEQFAKDLFDLGTRYNNAYLAVERNNHGHAVLLMLQKLGYPNLFWHRDLSRSLRASKSHAAPVLGWPTNMKTKALMEDTLKEALNTSLIATFDEKFLDECLSYSRLPSGKTGAQPGSHDDRVMKHGIALMARNTMPTTTQSGILGPRFRLVTSARHGRADRDREEAYMDRMRGQGA